MIPYTSESYELLHRGVIALAEVESNGICIDTEYLGKSIRRTKRKIQYLEEELASSDVGQVWTKVYGKKANFYAGEQLGKILFDKMGFPAPAVTGTGKFKTDEKALATVDHPFVKTYLKLKKLDKALHTYLIGIQREVVDGLLHPFFNLHLASTYRSSSDTPNFQNMPVRNKEIMKLIRTSFVPRAPGRRIVEIDYGGIEVRIAACYHKDPAMISYIEDPTKDMHRDMAVECYKLRPEQVTKDIRYCGKNMFVFPQFYGDWYIDCARHLWEAIRTMKLTTADGIPVAEHLAAQGIHSLGDLNPKEQPKRGTFEHHIQQVEKRFWEKRFPVYTAWKKAWYKAYQNKGYFLTKTGFICQGFMKRNEVINYPVQGSAFHCLLMSLIQLVMNELKARKMLAIIMGQIHDSIVADVPDSEMGEFLKIVNYVTTVWLREHWKWIIVPLAVEAEAAPVGGSWAMKAKVEIPQ